VNLKPPRYLLRECALKNILKFVTPGKFIEIGYGSGANLELLASLGFYGYGYDFSQKAQQLAQKRIDRLPKSVNISLRSNMVYDEKFDFVFLFEVIGYAQSPVSDLEQYRSMLNEKGSLIFSFVQTGYEYPRQTTGDMRYFSRQEMHNILSQAGLTGHIINYGYPLANWLRILAKVSSKFSSYGREFISNKCNSSGDMAIENTGMAHTRFHSKLASIIFTPLIVLLFAKIQKVFRNSDKGNGYIVVASKQ